MKLVVVLVCLARAVNSQNALYPNSTLDAVANQLLDFKTRHPLPIGVLTTTAGRPIDVRETVTLNTDVFNNQYFWDLQSGADHERIPERPVHARGTGAYGYFEVTNDVSEFTKADVFNVIGKRTPVVVRFSYLLQSIGGIDLMRETGGLATKFYTNDGNLDLVGISIPVFLYKQPHVLSPLAHAFKRNPKTNIIDYTARVDMINRLPETLHNILWLLSDYGINNGFRKMDAFPAHAFELVNKHGDSYFARFNFRTEQGLELLTEQAATALRGYDPDYSIRDLYDAIAEGNFPSWRLDIDVIPKHEIPKLNYNPFDLNILWRNGTYRTVTIGRMVLNRNVDNTFKDVEQAAYNPGNLVPGIPGPIDEVFKVRRFAYRDAQNYRLSINHNNIEVNMPKYRKTYNRDGRPPVRDNMRDAPNYYQNSFNGPAPYVDVAKPKERLSVKTVQSTDLQELSYFYNRYVNTEGKKIRLSINTAAIAGQAEPFLQKELLRILYLIDPDFGRRVEIAIPIIAALRIAQRPTLVVVEENPRTLDVIPCSPPIPNPTMTPTPPLVPPQQFGSPMSQPPSGPPMSQPQLGPPMTQPPSVSQISQPPSGPQNSQLPSGPQMPQLPFGPQMSQPPFGPQMSPPPYGPKNSQPPFGPPMSQPPSVSQISQPPSGPQNSQPPSGPQMPQPPFGPQMSQPPFGPQIAQPLSGPQVSHPPFGPQMSQPPFGPQMSQPPYGPQNSQRPSGAQKSQPPSGPQTSQPPSGPQMSQLPSGPQTSQPPPGPQMSQPSPGAPMSQVSQPPPGPEMSQPPPGAPMSQVSQPPSGPQMSQPPSGPQMSQPPPGSQMSQPPSGAPMASPQ